LGAAILGLVGSGIVETLAQAIQATVQVVETRQPEPEVQARYEDYYQLYRSTYFSLLPTFELAAKRGL
jgi:xylulokinase